MFKSTKLFRLNKVFLNRIAVEFHSSSLHFAGHSKWANIKHTKGAKDAQRATIFQRMSRKIRLAVQGTLGFHPNRNQLATILRKTGSTFAGTVHMFYDRGIVECVGNDKLTVKSPEELEEMASEHAIEFGAEEVEVIDADAKHLTFICEPLELERVKQKVSALGYNVETAEHIFIPNNPITLSPAELEAYEKMKERLRALDGLDAVYDNLNVDD